MAPIASKLPHLALATGEHLLVGAPQVYAGQAIILVSDQIIHGHLVLGFLLVRLVTNDIRSCLLVQWLFLIVIGIV